jgi:hypothetical protein
LPKENQPASMSRHRISHIKRALGLLLCAAFAVTGVSAQTCSTKVDQLPESKETYGFRVGMTFEQARAHVPSIQLARPDQFGVAKISINPFYDTSLDKIIFVDVRTISLDFLDGRLVTLWIGYESTFKWQTIDQLVAGVSKSLNVSDRWTATRSGRQLTCNGFSLFASMIAGSPSLRISDETAQQTIATRREEAAATAEAAAAIATGDWKTKLYYPADCSGLTRVAEPDRVQFKDKDEAEKAGYKLARDCQ